MISSPMFFQGDHAGGCHEIFITLLTSNISIYCVVALSKCLSEFVGVLFSRFVNLWRCEISQYLASQPLKQRCKYACAHQNNNVNRARVQYFQSPL